MYGGGGGRGITHPVSSSKSAELLFTIFEGPDIRVSAYLGVFLVMFRFICEPFHAQIVVRSNCKIII